MDDVKIRFGLSDELAKSGVWQSVWTDVLAYASGFPFECVGDHKQAWFTLNLNGDEFCVSLNRNFQDLSWFMEQYLRRSRMPDVFYVRLLAAFSEFAEQVMKTMRILVLTSAVDLPENAEAEIMIGAATRLARATGKGYLRFYGMRCVRHDPRTLVFICAHPELYEKVNPYFVRLNDDGWKFSLLS
ncbi:MAG: hypothetical protein ACOZBH_04375 [Patescibacteria group bacterium]